MTVRRLIVSDFHFGSGDDLMRSARALERIEPELAWADEVVINGDLFELVFASLSEAVAAARPFLSLVNRHVERIHFLPGNHDHHLVALAGDERRLAELTGDPNPPPFRVMPAECSGRCPSPGAGDGGSAGARSCERRPRRRSGPPHRAAFYTGRTPMGNGVIGNTPASGAGIWGSSPCSPVIRHPGRPRPTGAGRWARRTG